VDGGMVLNGEPVTLKVGLDTPRGVLEGPSAKASLALTSKHLNIDYQGQIQRQPVDGLDGVFKLDIASVGKLAAWLERPLAKGQPDPGPLSVHATFTGDGAKVALKEAVIKGKAVDARATGSYDGSGERARFDLTVETGMLDVDRYLPPADDDKKAARTTRKAKRENPLDALPDQPFDLGALRSTDGNIKIAIKGIKAAGFVLGATDFTAQLESGVLNADLSRLALYGGTVAGKLALDASGKQLTADGTMNIDKVKVDGLVEAASGEKSIVGIATGNAKVQSKGNSPRAMAQNLTGKLSFALGGVNVKNAPAGAISALEVDLDLPGLDKKPKFQGNVVYNKEKVDFAATVDPLEKLLSSDRFGADLKLSSKPVKASYLGSVQHQPIPGLAGKFDLDVPSVAVLARWLGQPLAKGQPDPGPLKVSAEMASDGDDMLLKEASIIGKAIKASASGSFKAEKPAPRFDANIVIHEANLNAYLPPEKKKKAKKAAKAPAGPPPWSREPIDFSGLSSANGKAVVSLAKVKYRNLVINSGKVTATMEKGVLTASIEQMKVADGTINAKTTVDASGKQAKISYQTSVEGVQARPLMKALMDNDRLSGKTTVAAQGSTSGRSEYDLVKGLNGKGSFKFVDGAIHGINIAATLRKAKSLGMDQSAGKTEKTDFAELGGTYVIKNGVVDNRDFKILAPVLRVNGAGLVPMPPQAVDYKVEAKLVATSKGQGGKDSLAGLPIPVHITGTWQKPAYKVDWDSVFKQIAADPARLSNMSGDLRNAAKGMGISLPGLDAGNLIKGLTGGGSGTGSGTSTGTDSAPKTAPKSPVDALKGLLKR
jgi:AsmA protein